MTRVVRELVRPVEQARSETDLQTDIRIVGVILSEQVRLESAISARPEYVARVIVKVLDSHGYKPERIVEAINHAQKLVAQSNANPA
jgi:DNA-directed RNA polymerase specialized sigma54-like protein